MRSARINLVSKLSDPRFRALYIAVARLFSERLALDLRIADELEALNSTATTEERIGLLKSLSLGGKWAPTPSGAHDRHTNIATDILLLQTQISSRYSSAPLDPATSTFILRGLYHRFILTASAWFLSVTENIHVSQPLD